MLASLARCGYLWQRGGLGVIQLKEKSISTGSKLELQRPLNVLNFFRKIVGPVSIHERFWVQTSENTPGAFSIDEQKVLPRPGEFVGDVEHVSFALHSLLGGRWVTFWDLGNWIQVVCIYMIYKLSLFGCQSNISAVMPCPSKFAGCFKPNECQKPAIFHETLVMGQLVQSLGMTWVALGGWLGGLVVQTGWK